MARSIRQGTLKTLVANDRVWGAIDSTILRATRALERARRQATEPPPKQPIAVEAIGNAAPDLTVRHGPFRGMQYPPEALQRASSPRANGFLCGSVFFPKLIGSYERELHPVLETICGIPYTEIVDVGCGEGYYAVGLAMRIPSAKVYAYDTNHEAIYLCGKMAERNGVADRVVTGGWCDVDTLRAMSLSGRALIVSDCEGYERELFTDDSCALFQDHDLLVEAHDFIDIEISAALRRRFEKTHVITTIQSVDDIAKAHNYSYPEVDGYDLATRRILLGERRPTIMEWLYMTPRARGAG